MAAQTVSGAGSKTGSATLGRKRPLVAKAEFDPVQDGAGLEWFDISGE